MSLSYTACTRRTEKSNFANEKVVEVGLCMPPQAMFSLSRDDYLVVPNANIDSSAGRASPLHA